MNSDNWPSIQLPENLELLNEMADNCFELGTFEGMLAATLMYHQILEAMCMHILEDCHFFIQLSVYPVEIKFEETTDKMFGFYIKMLKSTISFLEKDEFIKKVEAFNACRINLVHKLRRSNLELLTIELKKVRCNFDEIYNIYDEIQDDFRVTFHSMQKDTFAEYLNDEEYDNYFE